jgi:hypothetical protein
MKKFTVIFTLSIFYVEYKKNQCIKKKFDDEIL